MSYMFGYIGDQRFKIISFFMGPTGHDSYGPRALRMGPKIDVFIINQNYQDVSSGQRWLVAHKFL